MKKRINIIGKVDKDNYKDFSNSDFIGYEIYLSSADDFKYLPAMAKRMNIVSVHQPSGDFNLCSDKDLGERSYAILQKMLTVLKKNNYRGVAVIHGAIFNETISSKEEHLKIMAKRVDKLAKMFPGIKISLESDVLFFNQVKSRRALLAEPEDFMAIKKYLKTPLYITLDFEHIWITSVFKDFIINNPRCYAEINDLSDLNKPKIKVIKKAWLGYLKENNSRLDEIILRSFKKYKKLKSSIINFHLNGSNTLNYWFDSKTFIPLLGEHLSIKEADDNLNHALVRDNIRGLTDLKEINVVLEIWPRNLGQYVSELKKSGQIAKNIYTK